VHHVECSKIRRSKGVAGLPKSVATEVVLNPDNVKRALRKEHREAWAAETLGAVAHFRVSIFTAEDAGRILASVNYPARHDVQRTVDILNNAVRITLARISSAMAEPASDQRDRLRRLQRVTGDALNIMRVDRQARPTNADQIRALSMLFPEGFESEDFTTLAQRMGFKSSIEAAELSLIGLWCLHRLSGEAADHMQAHPEPKARAPDPFRLAWAATMIEAYETVFNAKAAKFNAEESPLLTFCKGVRTVILKHVPPDDGSAVVAQLLGALQQKPSAFAHFIQNNYDEARLVIQPKAVR
jgi:hypothetical protein